MLSATAVSRPNSSKKSATRPTGRLLINDADEILYANTQARHFLGLLSEEALPKGQKFIPLLLQTFRFYSNTAWLSWPKRALPTTPQYLIYTSPQGHTALYKVEIIEQIHLEGKKILAIAIQLVETQMETAVSHLIA